MVFSTGKSILQSQWCSEAPSCKVTPLDEHARLPESVQSTIAVPTDRLTSSHCCLAT